MLNENGDAVGFVVELQKKIFVAQLRESAFGQALVSAQAAQGFFEISGANLVVHESAELNRKDYHRARQEGGGLSDELGYTPAKITALRGDGSSQDCFVGGPCMDWYFQN